MHKWQSSRNPRKRSASEANHSRNWKSDRRDRNRRDRNGDRDSDRDPNRSRFREEECGDVNVNSSKRRRPWFHEFNGRIVSMDVETVPCIDRGSRKKFVTRAATVSIVNQRLEVIYEAKIYHKTGSFQVSRQSLAINGFQHDSFENGKPFGTVRDEVRSVLEGNLVVMLGAKSDFQSLDLSLYDFHVFDIQRFWYRERHDPKSDRVHTESLGLRSLCHHYFNVDMQPKGKIHEASDDAKWTMRLFQDAYMNHPRNYEKVNTRNSNEIPHYRP